ncbi:MAG: hypothetical protein IJ763_02165 [Lachnospiraceae bacterium]|nr:hypothetical protein [Lachnospiraceae bacterium]
MQQVKFRVLKKVTIRELNENMNGTDDAGTVARACGGGCGACGGCGGCGACGGGKITLNHNLY